MASLSTGTDQTVVDDSISSMNDRVRPRATTMAAGEIVSTA